MVSRNEALGINGAEFVAKGLERGFVEIDKATGREALAPHLRPSTWINIIWGTGVQLFTVMRRVRGPWDLIGVSEGAHHLTKIVDYLEEYVAPPVAARVVYRPAPSGAGNQRVLTSPPTVRVGVPASYDVNPYKG